MHMPLWWNWQTHIAQNDARATSCRFDSDQRHMSYYRKLPLNPDKELRAYVIGLAIGDGNLSNPNWIKESNKYIIPYLRGLIETDGSIYSDRGYPMMMFTSIIKKLAEEVKDLIEVLGFKAKLYTIKPSANSPFNQQILYHVRLSRDVQKFLDLVQPDKS